VYLENIQIQSEDQIEIRVYGINTRHFQLVVVNWKSKSEIININLLTRLLFSELRSRINIKSIDSKIEIESRTI